VKCSLYPDRGFLVLSCSWLFRVKSRIYWALFLSSPFL
jgi:hypothetical protein